MYVSTLDKLPKTTHFALIEQATVYHEGDERSRTHPGHGYPAYSENVLRYQAFDTKQQLLQAVSTLINSNAKFAVMEVKPLQTRTNLQISVD